LVRKSVCVSFSLLIGNAESAMEAATVDWFTVLGLSAEEREGLFSIDVLLVCLLL